ncbi:hypothetical protein QWV57_05510 [Geobacillus zalihae]|uniref:hypothetical protein n=1 Tax=Geobacillus zalihae TaxID=213419 RepID=UPI00261FE8AC|nr:hypothetical protein [Geobacillus zalihae]WKA48421.1 hypothetical protein QWV57_05510 [Geobacillus zalihae]
MKIVFHKIEVDTIESNAGIYIGQNNANGFRAHAKNVSAIRSIRGVKNIFKQNIILIFDEDGIDMPIVDKGAKTVVEQRTDRHGRLEITKKSVPSFPAKRQRPSYPPSIGHIMTTRR